MVVSRVTGKPIGEEELAPRTLTVVPDALVTMASRLLHMEDAVKDMCYVLQQYATEYTVPDDIKDKLWDDAQGEGDRRECPECGLLKYYEDFHLDHIIPSSRVRIHVAENLQLLCGSCNIKNCLLYTSPSPRDS